MLVTRPEKSLCEARTVPPSYTSTVTPVPSRLYGADCAVFTCVITRLDELVTSIGGSGGSIHCTRSSSASFLSCEYGISTTSVFIDITTDFTDPRYEPSSLSISGDAASTSRCIITYAATTGSDPDASLTRTLSLPTIAHDGISSAWIRGCSLCAREIIPASLSLPSSDAASAPACTRAKYVLSPTGLSSSSPSSSSNIRAALSGASWSRTRMYPPLVVA